MRAEEYARQFEEAMKLTPDATPAQCCVFIIKMASGALAERDRRISDLTDRMRRRAYP